MPEQELAAYKGPAEQLTVVGLDTHCGGLPPFTTFTLAEWNANGDGTNSVVQTIDTGAAGVARFSVPLTAAFALTTVPMW